MVLAFLEKIERSYPVRQRVKIAVDMSGNVEKRQFPRARIKWSVTMQTSQGVINTETHDVSVKGAFIRSWKPLECGEIFELFMGVPTLDRPLLVDAKVIWTSDDVDDYSFASRGMGVQFIEISSHDRRLLDSMIPGG